MIDKELMFAWSYPFEVQGSFINKNWSKILNINIKVFWGQEDSLEKGMATHSSVLAWRIPWTEEPSELQSIGSQSIQSKGYSHKSQTCLSD